MLEVLFAKRLLCLQVVEVLATLGADLTLPDEALATPYDWALAGLSYLGERYATLGGVAEVVFAGLGGKVAKQARFPFAPFPPLPSSIPV